MTLPCPIEELAQSFIDAQLMLEELYKISNTTPDKKQADRQALKQKLISQNPYLFPIPLPAE